MYMSFLGTNLWIYQCSDHIMPRTECRVFLVYHLTWIFAGWNDLCAIFFFREFLEFFKYWEICNTNFLLKFTSLTSCISKLKSEN